MMNSFDCLCLTCEKEPKCDASRLLRDYQTKLLCEKWIWDRKIYITFEVTSCPDYKKIVKKIRRTEKWEKKTKRTKQKKRR